MNTVITSIVLMEYNSKYSLMVYCLETDNFDHDKNAVECTFENESSSKDMSIYHVKKISDRLYDVGFLAYRTINNYLPGGERIVQPLYKMDNIVIDINNIYFFIKKKDTPYCISVNPELYIDKILF